MYWASCSGRVGLHDPQLLHRHNGIDESLKGAGAFFGKLSVLNTRTVDVTSEHHSVM